MKYSILLGVWLVACSVIGAEFEYFHAAPKAGSDASAIEAAYSAPITGFSDQSRAELEGLKKGDLIIGIDDIRVYSDAEYELFRWRKPGPGSVRISVVRKGKVTAVDFWALPGRRLGVLMEFGQPDFPAALHAWELWADVTTVGEPKVSAIVEGKKKPEVQPEPNVSPWIDAFSLVAQPPLTRPLTLDLYLLTQLPGRFQCEIIQLAHANPKNSRTWVRDFLKAYLCLRYEKYADAKQIISGMNRQVEVGPLLQGALAFYGKIADRRPDFAADKPHEAYGCSVESFAACYPWPSIQSSPYDTFVKLKGPAFAQMAEVGRYTGKTRKDELVAYVTEKVLGGTSETEVYLRQVKNGIVFPEEYGGWATKSMKVAGRASRPVILAELSLLFDKADAKERVFIALAMVVPAVYEGNAETLSQALSVLILEDPALYHMALNFLRSGKTQKGSTTLYGFVSNGLRPAQLARHVLEGKPISKANVRTAVGEDQAAPSDSAVAALDAYAKSLPAVYLDFSHRSPRIRAAIAEADAYSFNESVANLDRVVTALESPATVEKQASLRESWKAGAAGSADAYARFLAGKIMSSGHQEDLNDMIAAGASIPTGEWLDWACMWLTRHKTAQSGLNDFYPVNSQIFEKVNAAQYERIWKDLQKVEKLTPEVEAKFAELYKQSGTPAIALAIATTCRRIKAFELANRYEEPAVYYHQRAYYHFQRWRGDERYAVYALRDLVSVPGYGASFHNPFVKNCSNKGNLTLLSAIHDVYSGSLVLPKENKQHKKHNRRALANLRQMVKRGKPGGLQFMIFEGQLVNHGKQLSGMLAQYCLDHEKPGEWTNPFRQLAGGKAGAKPAGQKPAAAVAAAKPVRVAKPAVPAGPSAAEKKATWDQYQKTLKEKQRSTYTDGAGVIWTVTEGSNVYSSNPKTLEVKGHKFSKIFSLDKVATRDLAIAGGYVWAATDKGLFRYNLKRKDWSRNAIRNRVVTTDVSAVAAKTKGFLTVTYGGGKTAQYDLAKRRWK